MSKHSGGHYLLQGLVDCGVEYIFGNFGTDHVTIVEELARWQHEGRKAPDVILCPHENTAVHMAGGYAAATGRGQAVLVHVDAGTANAAMGMHNLARTRLPVLLMAGRAPHTIRGELTGSRDNYVHFVQDPFDIGSIVRNYVKWEYALPSGVVTREVFRRAHSMMHSDPQGPVYLTLPRETLAEEWEDDRVNEFTASRYGAVASAALAPQDALAFADALLAAENPIAVTSYLGRKPAAVAALVALAEATGLRVIEAGPSFLNFPRDHACFGGFDPVAAMKGADLGLLLDVDVPWIPKFAPEANRLRWLQLDVDAIKCDFPMWGFAADLRLQADCAIGLTQVLEAVRARAPAGYAAKVQARIAGFAPQRDARAARLRDAAAKQGERDAVTPDFLCATLATKMGAEDIVLNEAIRNTGCVLNQIPRSLPGTYYSSAGGGLGSTAGMALGVKLANPDKRVIHICGDGTFQFSNPDSVFAVAGQYGVPIFSIVLDNRGWQAVKESVLRVYPAGTARETDVFQARLDNRQQGAVRHFEEVGQAFGAHGERVETPEELSAALDRCLAAIDRGQAAVLTLRTAAL
jgi:acetolactate synthase I/II/III large subunit